MEVYAQDADSIIWPLIIWLYSLEAEAQLSENDQVLKVLSLLDEYFGLGFGIYVMDQAGDRINLTEAFLACKRHSFDFAQDRFIIRQRGDRTVILENGVWMILRDLAEHLLAESGDWLVYQMVYLPDVERALYEVEKRAFADRELSRCDL